MIVVSDTSPVRALAHLECLELLQQLFGEVLIPPAVDLELRHASSRFPRVSVDQFAFLRIESPQDQEQVRQFRERLDPGESEALALAIERRADAVLIDEAAGRQTAKDIGLHPIGTLGILIRAKQSGDFGAIRPSLDRLEKELRLAGE